MSGFLRQIYTDTNLTAYGLLVFFGFFISACAWVFLRKGARTHYESMGNLPLNEGECCERR